MSRSDQPFRRTIRVPRGRRLGEAGQVGNAGRGEATGTAIHSGMMRRRRVARHVAVSMVSTWSPGLSEVAYDNE